ncbi:hypothetical protein Q4Q34_16895 [Flavivirga abyssicola]|uniref:hypothetical protein n=1 Tax=Flavivirga abyssicola TaxID=3063533 RepID=UPI0026E10FB6|nr:hypothetical protein [Flavivirga sp. MEBiC07777]WVK12894.1 hypothetical protein Q4Q34_16895 [Flavivirga sp. MEBiC07777]
MDDFEKYIKENKALFDVHKADKSKLWENIESGLNKPESKTKIIKLWSNPLFKVAATVIIALGVFSIINISIVGGASKNIQNNVALQELNDINSHYKGLVAYQVRLVNKNTQLSPEEKKEFLSFMDELDIEYEILKEELQKNVDTERVLEAIVINYKKRIELIENLLEQINSSKKLDNDDAYTL